MKKVFINDNILLLQGNLGVTVGTVAIKLQLWNSDHLQASSRVFSKPGKLSNVVKDINTGN